MGKEETPSTLQNRDKKLIKKKNIKIIRDVKTEKRQRETERWRDMERKRGRERQRRRKQKRSPSGVSIALGRGPKPALLKLTLPSALWASVPVSTRRLWGSPNSSWDPWMGAVLLRALDLRKLTHLDAIWRIILLNDFIVIYAIFSFLALTSNSNII